MIEAPGEKRQKISEDLTADLLCPITLALPFDPVTAADGKIYERSAIEEYIKTEKGKTLKSPVTNEKMTRVLLPSHQTRNLIEKSIEHGIITGELATAWLKKKKDKETVSRLTKEGNKGNGAAASDLAFAYEFGHHGLQADEKAAKPYWKIASDAGDIMGMLRHGEALLRESDVVDTKFLNALSLITQAAMGGSTFGCLIMGELLSGEPHCLWSVVNPGAGKLQNKSHAVRFLEKGLNSNNVVRISATEPYKDSCRELLKRLKDE